MLCPPTVLYTNVHSRLICKSQNLETAQMSNSFEQVVPPGVYTQRNDTQQCRRPATVRCRNRCSKGNQSRSACRRAPHPSEAVRVLHSVCQQIRKTQQWPEDWERSVFIPVSKKGNARECSDCRTIVFISHASKIMLRILQARLQQSVNQDLPDVQAAF